jgi:hypothetical protein
MGIAWLAREIIEQELADEKLVSYEADFGSTELDIVLFYRDEVLAAKVGEAIAQMGDPG